MSKISEALTQKKNDMTLTNAQKTLLAGCAKDIRLGSDPYGWWEPSLDDSPRTIKSLEAKGLLRTHEDGEDFQLTDKGLEAIDCDPQSLIRWFSQRLAEEKMARIASEEMEHTLRTEVNRLASTCPEAAPEGVAKFAVGYYEGKIAAVKYVRQITGLGLKEALHLVETAAQPKAEVPDDFKAFEAVQRAKKAHEMGEIRGVIGVIKAIRAELGVSLKEARDLYDRWP